MPVSLQHVFPALIKSSVSIRLAVTLLLLAAVAVTSLSSSSFSRRQQQHQQQLHGENSAKPVLGSRCDSDFQCQQVDTNSECDRVNNVCDCRQGLVSVRGRCQSTSSCIVDSDCSSSTSKICLQNKCACPTGTLPFNNACIAILNMPCKTIGECRQIVAGSTCDVALSRTCVCSDGMVASDDGRSCAFVLGSPCQHTHTCAVNLRHSECRAFSSQRQECVCVAGLRPNFLDALDVNTRCQETIGAPCTRDTQCDNFVENSVCTVSKCACRRGYTYDAITMTCNPANKLSRFLSSSPVDERLIITVSGSIQINTDAAAATSNSSQAVVISPSAPTSTLAGGSNIVCSQADQQSVHVCVGGRCLYEGFSCQAQNSICVKLTTSSNFSPTMYQCQCKPGFVKQNAYECDINSSGGGGGDPFSGFPGGSCPPLQQCPSCPGTKFNTPTPTPFPWGTPPTTPTPSPWSPWSPPAQTTPPPATAAPFSGNPSQPSCGVSPAGSDPFGISGQNSRRRAFVDERQSVNFNFTDNNLVVGGSPADVNEICWQIGLQHNKGGGRYSLCGGSILTSNWILTAGHCVVDGDTATVGLASPRDVFIIIGSLTNQPGELSTDSPGCTQRIRARQIIPHQQYAVQKDSGGNFIGIFNDIALIQLDTPIDFTSSAKCACPMCLSSTDFPAPGEVGVISGYGCQTSDCSDQSGFTPRQLQWARLAFVPDTAPSCFGTATSTFAKDYICVGGKFGVDACPGDSGGPFVAYDNARRVHYQVGVASFVVGNSDSICAVGNPARYTEVRTFLSWIQQYVVGLQTI